jgi:hypothetical protein
MYHDTYHSKYTACEAAIYHAYDASNGIKGKLGLALLQARHQIL